MPTPNSDTSEDAEPKSIPPEILHQEAAVAEMKHAAAKLANAGLEIKKSASEMEMISFKSVRHISKDPVPATRKRKATSQSDKNSRRTKALHGPSYNETSMAFEPARPTSSHRLTANMPQVLPAPHENQFSVHVNENSTIKEGQQVSSSYGETNMAIYAEKQPIGFAQPPAAQTSDWTNLPGEAQNMRSQMDRLFNYFPS
jgi:hypothetical protein